MKIDGTLLRQAREERAWTQEELSQRSQLGLRTVRRLEAGQGSLESLRRVAEALEVDPRSICVPPEDELKEWLRCDLIRVELASQLLGPDPSLQVERLCERIRYVRRHLARELGFPTPGVRLSDRLEEGGRYRIFIREVPRAEGWLEPGRRLAVMTREASLAGLDGPHRPDPTYSLPSVWILPHQREQAEAQGCMVFDDMSVLVTHLTHTIKRHAASLLGVEDTARLLDMLDQPRLVAEVIPSRLTLARLRRLLCHLLAEEVPIRDLALILETVLESSEQEPRQLAEACRRALGPVLTRVYADQGKLEAVRHQGDLEAVKRQGRELAARGGQPVVVTEPHDRLRVKEALPVDWVVLARDEIEPDIELTFQENVIAMG
ncbi:MAG: FHIPEP family type III secretion protein [Vulcanimicrobiota bacterium]